MKLKMELIVAWPNYNLNRFKVDEESLNRRKNDKTFVYFSSLILAFQIALLVNL